MPVLDRGLSGLKNHFISRILIISIAFSIIFGSISTVLIITQQNDYQESNLPAHLAYVTHSVISINGNAAFASQAISESWSGNGTTWAPYIIQGYDINASSADGILIRNTDVHFIIRDCHLHNGGSTYNGIHLNGTSNGTITNNNCSKNYDGIRLWSSHNNAVLNNTCSWNDDNGIFLWTSCKSNTVHNNTCTFNFWGGIYVVQKSDNNIITGNSCSDNYDGVAIASSSNNTIMGNICYNQNSGVYISTNSGNNTVYNNTCTNNYGAGIWVYSLKKNNILGNNASNNQNGIYLYSASNANVMANTFSNNSQNGVFLNMAYSNNISYNTVSNNVGYAVCIQNVASTNNRIWNNTFYHNKGSTDAYNPAKIQAADSGVSNRWNTSSGYGNYWSDLTGPDNSAPYGVVDWSYNLTGTAGAKDFYPLTDKPLPPYIPEFSDALIPIIGLMLLVLVFGRLRKQRGDDVFSSPLKPR